MNATHTREEIRLVLILVPWKWVSTCTGSLPLTRRRSVTNLLSSCQNRSASTETRARNAALHVFTLFPRSEEIREREA